MGDRVGPGKVEPAPAATSATARPMAELSALEPARLSPFGLAASEATGVVDERTVFASFDLSALAAAAALSPSSITGRAPLAVELGRAPIDPQLRPIVGAADDLFEREADRVATHALGMRAPPTDAPPPPDAPPLPVAPAGGDAPVDEAELTHGGRPLPARLRQFFEHRIGFDLGAVRVHEGADARDLSDAIAARAFTFSNHIWLGRGEPLAPTFTVAHELAHVVQQTQPNPLGARGVERGPNHVQRAPYWGASGGKNPHDGIVKTLGKESKIFNEAPIPGSARGLVGHSDTTGWADLYDGRTAIGLAFDTRSTPAKVFSPWSSKGTRTTLKDGKAFDTSQAAPKWNEAKKQITHVGDAPGRIGVGDVKPLPGSESFLGGLFSPGAERQLAGYIDGIHETARVANALIKAGQSSGKTQWSVTASLLAENKVKIPSNLQVSTKGTLEDLALYESGSKLKDQPAKTVKGALKVFTKPQHDGVWHYAFIPDPKTLAAASKKDPTIEALAAQIDAELIATMTVPPDIKAGAKGVKKRPAPYLGRPGRRAHRQMARLARDVSRQLRRGDREPPQQDTFDLDKWKGSQTSLDGKRQALQSKPEWKDAAGQKKAYDAHVALQKLVPSIGPPPPQLKTTAEAVGKIGFWLSWKGKLLARLRKAFGRIYIKIARAFYAIKNRVVEFFKSKSPSEPSDRWWVKVVQIAWKVIKFAAPRLIRSIFNTLWDALARGIIEKIKAYFPVDAIEDDVRTEAADLAKKLGLDNVIGDPKDLTEDGLVQKVVDKIGEQLGFDEDFHLFEKLVDVIDVINDIATLISIAKWGARIAAAGSQCAWPPAWGCLKIILIPLVEETALYLFDKYVATSCWFQHKVAKYVAEIDLFRYFGKKIGVKLVHKIQDASPELGSFFDVTSIENEQFGADEWPCDDEPSGALSEEQGELAEMAANLGEEGLKKLLNVGKGIADKDTPPDPKGTAQDLEDLLRGQPKPGGGMKRGEPTKSDRPPRDARPDAKNQKPGDKGEQKDDPANQGKPKPDDLGQKGDQGPEHPSPSGGPKDAGAGAGKDQKDAPPKNDQGGKPQPGDADANRPEGKPKPGAGGTPQPEKGGAQKGQPQPKPGAGANPLPGRAQQLIERLTKLRDQLQKQQQQRKKKEQEEQKREGSKGEPTGGAGAGAGKPTAGKPKPSPGGGAGGAGGPSPSAKGGPSPSGPVPEPAGGEGDKPKGDGSPGGAAKPDEKSDPAKPDAGKAGDKGDAGKGDAAKPDAGKGGGAKGDADKGGGAKGDDDQGGDGKGEAKKVPPAGGSAGAGAKPKDEKPKDDKPNDPPKTDPVDEAIDLLSKLIDLLKKIQTGQLKDDDEIDAAIAVLVDHAKDKVTLDPNADRIIFVFTVLGGSVEDGLGIKPKRDKGGKDKDKGKGKDEGDPDVAAVDGLDGEPADPTDAGGGGDDNEDDKGGDKGDDKPAPKDPKKPGKKGAGGGREQAGKEGPPGKPEDEGGGDGKEPGGGDKDKDQDKDKDKPDNGPEAPAPGKLALFDFDPLWSGGTVVEGYFVGINPPWRDTDLLVLSDDRTKIINRSRRVVAHVKEAGHGQVQLVSGSLVDLLEKLARTRADPRWRRKTKPVLKMDFSKPVLAKDDEPAP